MGESLGKMSINKNLQKTTTFINDLVRRSGSNPSCPQQIFVWYHLCALVVPLSRVQLLEKQPLSVATYH